MQETLQQYAFLIWDRSY